ncbi:hypothetical protein BDF14DRAFT_1910198 [Spinellus fusiger]|nr:hypothetical protein BDF14DRAFT_1910198 [Spinellus fusiger]
MEIYPVKTITDFNMYLDLKPPEMSKNNTPIPVTHKKDAEVLDQNMVKRVTYKHYKDAEKVSLFLTSLH